MKEGGRGWGENWGAKGGGKLFGKGGMWDHVKIKSINKCTYGPSRLCLYFSLACQTIFQCLLQVCLCASLVTSALGSCVLLRCKKWRCDKHFSGDVACKHQSFGRCAVSKLAVYSLRPSHTPLSGLRLIVCRLPYEEQLIYTESNCKRTWVRTERRNV